MSNHWDLLRIHNNVAVSLAGEKCKGIQTFIYFECGFGFFSRHLHARNTLVFQ